MTRAIDIVDLYRFFRAGEEEILALRGVSLHVDAGEIVAVVGPSGSGKSTLLNCAAGLDEPAGGTVRIGDERISHRPESERARIRASRIGVLMQSGNLVGHLSVVANVRLAQRLGGRSSDSSASLLQQVGLGNRLHALPSQLSGGETARAGLAVAVANSPLVLLADEPTGELDSESEQRVLAMLRQRAEAGCGVLVVTHSPRVVAIADRVVSLADGRVAA
jgi:putative ABC transport system ATP-binding protein